MSSMTYIGLDVHKKTISYCLKDASGRIIREGTISTRRKELAEWVRGLPSPWKGAMEATLFTGWIYDFLIPYAESLEVGHPVMMRAITAAKKKNDKLDARTIADLLRCGLLPACYMAPRPVRELRRALRFRNLLVRQATCMKNKTAGLLMEVGAEYNKQKLDGKRYFDELLDTVEHVPESVKQMLRMTRSARDLFEQTHTRLTRGLVAHPALRERVARLQSIRGVGPILALTWALEIGDPARFHNVGQARSYCGLTSALVSSAGKDQRAPLSKMRNQHLQTMLIEAAKVAAVWNPQLKQVYVRERERGNANRATLAVARKLVAYLLAVDRSGKPFAATTENVEAEEEVAVMA